MDAVRDCDALPYLRLKSAMNPSDCDAIFRNGTRSEVFLYRQKPVIEIDRQFYEASSYPGFVCFEKKPIAAPIPEPAVQLVNEPEVRDEPVDTSGQRLRLQLQRNSSAIYKRNIIRQVFGNLEVREYLGVGESDSTTRYWHSFCKLTGKYVTTTQADLVCGVVTCCSDAKTPKEQIVFRGARLP